MSSSVCICIYIYLEILSDGQYYIGIKKETLTLRNQLSGHKGDRKIQKNRNIVICTLSEKYNINTNRKTIRFVHIFLMHSYTYYYILL